MAKIEKNKRLDKEVFCFCAHCDKDDISHKVLVDATTHAADEEPDGALLACHEDQFDIVQCCCGCKTIRFLHTRVTTDPYEQHDDDPLIKKTVYPEPKHQKTRGVSYIGDEAYAMPRDVRLVYHETLTAISASQPILAGVGIRMMLEAICNDQKVKGKLFEQINRLVKKGLLTKSGAKIFHGIRILGNDAAHEQKPPTEAQLLAAVKVLEHLVIGAYVIPDASAVLPQANGAPDGSVEKRKMKLSSPRSRRQLPRHKKGQTAAAAA